MNTETSAMNAHSAEKQQYGGNQDSAMKFGMPAPMGNSTRNRHQEYRVTPIAPATTNVYKSANSFSTSALAPLRQLSMFTPPPSAPSTPQLNKHHGHMMMSAVQLQDSFLKRKRSDDDDDDGFEYDDNGEEVDDRDLQDASYSPASHEDALMMYETTPATLSPQQLHNSNFYMQQQDNYSGMISNGMINGSAHNAPTATSASMAFLQNQINSQRPAGAVPVNRRERHVQCEKKRRRQMKDSFDEMQAELPDCAQKKMSKAAVLLTALDHMRDIKRQYSVVVHECNRLRAQLVAQQPQLAQTFNSQSPALHFK